MRRYGAVAICAQDDIRHYDAEQINMALKYLFGWPAAGGVWVLRPPWKQATPGNSTDHLMTDEERMNDMIESALRDEVYYALADKLKPTGRYGGCVSVARRSWSTILCRH